jgi:hypothetical protein
MTISLRVVLGLAVVGMAACQPQLPLELPVLGADRPTDEDQVAGVLADVQRGMQERRIYKVLAHVSPNYYDSEGRDYAAIREYLTEIFDKYRHVRVTRTPPRIIVQGARARAIETFGTIAEPYDPFKDAPISLYGKVMVYLEKHQDTWRIVEWGTIE